MVIATAIKANAHYLVTRDKDLLVQSLTEATKALDAVAAAHHPDINHFYYSTFINMIYKGILRPSSSRT
jgi:predicted nucleic acid-binding protein